VVVGVVDGAKHVDPINTLVQLATFELSLAFIEARGLLKLYFSAGRAMIVIDQREFGVAVRRGGRNPWLTLLD